MPGSAQTTLHWAPDREVLPLLRMVERVEAGRIYLEPLSAWLDDDDTTESVEVAAAAAALRTPVFESGDKVRLRGSPGRIVRLIPYDMHVYIALDENPLFEHYTNIVQLDFGPTLDHWSADSA